jgi:hypothetical protein
MEDLRNTYACPACPEDCSDFVVPDIVSEDCLDSIVSELSEIKQLYIASIDPADRTKPLNGPTDWTSSAAWDAVISNTGTGVREIFGIGSIPAPESQSRTFHDNQSKVVNKQYELTFDIESIHPTNYEFLRKLQCGAKVRIWYMSRGDFMYGGLNGIPVQVFDATSPMDRGADAYKKLIFQFRWNALCDPERIPSPWSEVTP